MPDPTATSPPATANVWPSTPTGPPTDPRCCWYTATPTTPPCGRPWWPTWPPTTTSSPTTYAGQDAPPHPTVVPATCSTNSSTTYVPWSTPSAPIDPSTWSPTTGDPSRCGTPSPNRNTCTGSPPSPRCPAPTWTTPDTGSARPPTGSATSCVNSCAPVTSVSSTPRGCRKRPG